MAKEINIDFLYFVAIGFLALSSLFRSGFGGFFNTLATGIFGYIGMKMIFAWLNKN